MKMFIRYFKIIIIIINKNRHKLNFETLYKSVKYSVVNYVIRISILYPTVHVCQTTFRYIVEDIKSKIA